VGTGAWVNRLEETIGRVDETAENDMNTNTFLLKQLSDSDSRALDSVRKGEKINTLQNKNCLLSQKNFPRLLLSVRGKFQF
jgi:hypothetical protein